MRISDWSSDVCSSDLQFEPAVRRALSRPPELMAAVKAFADQLHPYRDGRSIALVLEAIDAFIAQGGRNRRRNPMNLWPQPKIRRLIGYWGPAHRSPAFASSRPAPPTLGPRGVQW